MTNNTADKKMTNQFIDENNMDKFLVEQYQEFHEFFFTQVTNRLNAIDPSIKYTLPELEFHGVLKEEDKIELIKLLNMMKPMHATYPSFREREMINEYDDETVYGVLDKYQELSSKFPEGTSGTYRSLENKVQLNSEYHMNNSFNFGSLPHELLHSIRHQSSDDPTGHGGYSKMQRSHQQIKGSFIKNQPELIDGEVVEFFGELDDIILQAVCKDEIKYSHLKPEFSVITVDILRESHKTFGKDLTTELDHLVEKYTDMMNYAKNMNQSDNSNWVTIGQKYATFAAQGTKVMHAYAYLLLVEEHSEQGLENLAKGVSTLFKSSKTKEDFLKESNTLTSLELAKKEFEQIDFCKTALHSYSDTAHTIAELAVDNAREDLEQNWDKVLLMHRDEVKAKYIQPVMNEINRMKEEYKERTRPIQTIPTIIE